MICAEARRQLSAPDPTQAAAIEAHLESCAPCRGESESLKEVDRRIGRLGEVRRNAARAAFARSPNLGRAATPVRGASSALVANLPKSAPAGSASVHAHVHLPSVGVIDALGEQLAPSAKSPELHGELTISRFILMLLAALLAPAILWWLLHRH